MPIAVATALATADKPFPELASGVVEAALRRSGEQIAHSVLLFLSADFARHAHAAVLAASRAAQCLYITGCTAPGVFTESDWVLDRPAACAMVFTGGASLAPAFGTVLPRLTLAVPQGASAHALAGESARFGVISTDGGAQNPGKLWCHGKLVDDGMCDVNIRGARAAITVSRGVRVISEPEEIAAVEGYDLLRLGAQPALDSLLRHLPVEVRTADKAPLHSLFAGVIDGAAEQAIEAGRFNLVPIIAAGSDERSVTLAARLKPGASMFWAMRQPLAAERDTRIALDQALAALGAAPDFAIIFSCMGRGPYFFDGTDRDLELAKLRLPGVPLAGAYGAGEIAPVAGSNRVLQNSAVFALFKADV